MFHPDLDNTAKEKIFYCLTMFPYPSGYGLHAGHASIFTINDVHARYKALQGYTVFNPFGFDSFGLPTENYAMKLGKPAYEVTEENTEHFIKQVKALNMSFDYKRMLSTSKPDYYKRTQRIFSKLYEKGLAYRDDQQSVNRCPECQTVLANDQVVDGKCERCKSEIIQKKHPQWFIKITDYADRLIDDLDLVDRPKETIKAQRNWIGRKEGINISYEIKGYPGKKIEIFTTRPDTNFGATFVVIAPDSKFIEDYKELFPNRKTCEEYVKRSLAKTTVERLKDGKKKTGVPTGLSVINNLNGKELPLYIGDFVLSNVGTGAVVGVPGHDLRDFEFAQAMGIDIIRVVVGKDGDTSPITRPEQVQEKTGKMINSSFLDGLPIMEAKEKIKDHIEKNKRGRRIISYRLRDRSVSRQRYRGSPIPVYYDDEGNTHLIPENELPVKLPLDVKNYKPKGKSPLADHPSFPVYKKDEKEYRRECDTLDTFMCSSFYFLRYPDANNPDELIKKELGQKMFPIDFYCGGKEHTVGHLLYSRFIHKFLYDEGYVASPEPFKKLVHQGMILGADGRKMSKRRGNVIDPLDIIEKFDADTMRTYIMFMGPVDQDKARNDGALNGIFKFLKRIKKLTEKTNHYVSDLFLKTPPKEQDIIMKKAESLTHKTLKGMKYDMDNLKFNTAISKIMILINGIYDFGYASTETLTYLAIILAPFATETAQKLRTKLGHEGSVHQATRPTHDEAKIAEENINLPVQVNGKIRGTIDITPGTNQEICVEKAQKVENIKKHIEGKETRKIIFKENKILNIIVG